ncbi:MAG: AAA family ATPase [Acidobacteriota bacterium]
MSKAIKERNDALPTKVVTLSIIDDHIVRLIDNSQGINKNQLFNEFVNDLGAFLKVPGSSFEKLLGPELTPAQKKVLALCLLRLHSVETEVQALAKNRIRVQNIFDESFTDTIYKAIKIDPKDQGYLKMAKLRDVLVTKERLLFDNVHRVGSLHDLLGIRQEFMKQLNDQVGKTIIQSFLPDSLLESRLNRCFQLIKEYVDETDIDSILESYQAAVETIADDLSVVKTYGTDYSKKYVESLLSKALRYLKEDFETRPVGKPADIHVTTTDKKYPLYIVNERFDCLLKVENKGTGYAFDANYYIEEATDNITVEEHSRNLGTLLPQTSRIVQVPCRVVESQGLALFKVSVSWKNANGQETRKDFDLEINAQSSDIDWAILSTKNPYSLEPITSDDELVGREDNFKRLINKAMAENVESSFMYGQKRVGKTSLAKALRARLEKISKNDYVVILLESGSYIDPDPQRTISNLGKRLCKELTKAEPRLRNLSIPDFDGALSPITEFLDNALEIIPTLRLLVILDEFDDLPLELFKRDPVGTAFFLTLRTISNQTPLGFVLVGGEKMEFVINSMGEQLNKFEPIRVDYFKKETDWTDFENLIKKPLEPWFEFNDESINLLYSLTAGNPYFTKLICQSLFSIMINRRDAYVTFREIVEAKQATLRAVKGNSFQHFWEDGITERGARKEEISINRKKILIAVGEAARESAEISKETLLQLSKNLGVSDAVAESEIREFIRRQVLVELENPTISYKCKALLFQEWLTDQGIKELITTFTEHDELITQKNEEEAAYITPDEILNVSHRWVYRGNHISADEVRLWLKQFGDNRNQRVMFKILSQLKFFDADSIRNHMHQAHGIVKRGYIQEIKEGKRKKEEVLVSYLDGPAKSGAQCAKIYADENKIYSKNVVEKAKLYDALQSNDKIKALVFIDDFLGTGRTAIEHFTSLAEELGELLVQRPIYFIALCGFEDAKNSLIEAIENLGLDVNVHVLNILDNSYKCFSDDSRIYPDVTERQKAKQMAKTKGEMLEKNNPLGFGDCEAAIVFEYNCPNNSLPILWKAQKGWAPLFLRQY